MQASTSPAGEALTRIPSVDRVLGTDAMRHLLVQYGRTATLRTLRDVMQAARADLLVAAATVAPQIDDLVARCSARLAAAAQASLRPVLNLTGVVLHTSLGRAPLPAEAIEAVAAVMAAPCNLELDLASGRRGERDHHVEALICELTGAEAACLVNNNAAALLLVLNTLSRRRQVPVSRGELIEIGGSFRLPEIMARAGCTLVEVGTTNRTHAADFAQAIGPRTALLLKVHPSNFAITGFTAAVAEPELAALAASHGLPLVSDLGSGALIGLERFGLPREPTLAQTLENGAALVLASGDKLLGGPQAGIIAGRKEFVERLRRNPLKRALRVDKMTLAALEAVLRLYRNPDDLARRLPALRLLSRPADEIERQGLRLLPVVQACLPAWAVRLETCSSQIGSGAAPTDRLPGWALVIRRRTPRHAGPQTLATRLRALSVPVLGRLQDDALVLDLRCLGDDEALLAQLRALPPEAS